MQPQDISISPVITAALINVFAVIAISTLSPILQSKRDNKRWEREKLYDLHSETYKALTDLLKSVAAINTLKVTEISSEFYASVGTLNRLRLAYVDEQAKEILLIEESLKALYKGFLIQKSELDKLEELRQKLLVIAQNDSRLKDLFK